MLSIISSDSRAYFVASCLFHRPGSKCTGEWIAGPDMAFDRNIPGNQLDKWSRIAFRGCAYVDFAIFAIRVRWNCETRVPASAVYVRSAWSVHSGNVATFVVVTKSEQTHHYQPNKLYKNFCQCCSSLELSCDSCSCLFYIEIIT